MSAREIVERERSLAFGFRITTLLLLNMALWWIGYLALDGSAMFSEIHEAEPHVRRWTGDEVLVSKAAETYSFWHSLSVLLTLPGLALSAAMLVCEWVGLQRLRRRIASLS